MKNKMENILLSFLGMFICGIGVWLFIAGVIMMLTAIGIIEVK